MKVAIPFLCLLIGTLAYFAAVAPKNTNMQDASWFRVRIPPPTIAPEEIQRESKYLYKVAEEVNKVPLFIAGKEVVLTTRDQQVMSRAMARHASGTHE